MKVAVFICGQGRNVLNSFESIKKNILDVYDTDVYCQLWWDDEIKNNGYDGLFKHYDVQPDLPELINKLYSPKKFLIEPPINNWGKPELENFRCPSKEPFLSQFYSVQNASNLFNWDEYDFIIKCRYDVNVIKIPNLHTLDKTKMYTGFDNGEFYYDDPYYFSDILYILPNHMKQFTQIIDNLNNFKQYDDCVPEHVFVNQVKNLNIMSNIIRLNIDEYSCNVIRN